MNLPSEKYNRKGNDREMEKTIPKVKCIAKECNFWIPGDFCVAGHIDITNNEKGREASTVDETMCETFTARIAEVDMDEAGNKKLEDLLTNSGSEDPGIHPEVRCIVDSCIYWGENDTCIKPKIEILYKESRTAQESACEDYKQKTANGGNQVK